MLSPRRTAASSSGRLRLWSPSKSTSPPSSNQSMPVVTASLNSPAGRISLPSASTRQPAWTRSRVTCPIRLGSSIVQGLEPRVLRLAEPELEQKDVGLGLDLGTAADDQAPVRSRPPGGRSAGRDQGAL